MNNLNKKNCIFGTLNNNIGELSMRLSYLESLNAHHVPSLCESIKKLNECVMYMNNDIDEIIANHIYYNCPNITAADDKAEDHSQQKCVI